MVFSSVMLFFAFGLIPRRIRVSCSSCLFCEAFLVAREGSLLLLLLFFFVLRSGLPFSLRASVCRGLLCSDLLLSEAAEDQGACPFFFDSPQVFSTPITIFYPLLSHSSLLQAASAFFRRDPTGLPEESPANNRRLRLVDDFVFPAPDLLFFSSNGRGFSGVSPC